MSLPPSYQRRSEDDECTSLLVYSSSEDDDEEEVSTTLPRSRRRRQRSRSNNRSSLMVWGLVLLSVASLLLLLPHIPSQQERDIALAYDLPVLGYARQIRDSQNLADTAQNEHFVKSIQHHHSKDYMNVPLNCEATVLLLRHCEKSDIREHCSYLGYERSVYLASQFGSEPADRWPLPNWIFAESPNGRHNRQKMNFREIETVGPLARKAGVTVDDSYGEQTVNQLARELLTFLHTGQMCGKVAVVSWKHSNIGHLAHHLGCGPLQGCPMDYSGKTFDSVWQIKYVYRKFDHSNHKSLKLDRGAEWRVFGSVAPEGFDPLAFSKWAGDYSDPAANGNHTTTPHGGGASWAKAEVAYPERKRVSDTLAWKATRVGFESQLSSSSSSQQPHDNHMDHQD